MTVKRLENWADKMGLKGVEGQVRHIVTVRFEELVRQNVVVRGWITGQRKCNCKVLDITGLTNVIKRG